MPLLGALVGFRRRRRKLDKIGLQLYTVRADMARDFDSFYSLGYRSRHGGDGKYHRIDVRVKGEKIDVRHRTGGNGGNGSVGDRLHGRAG